MGLKRAVRAPHQRHWLQQGRGRPLVLSMSQDGFCVSKVRPWNVPDDIMGTSGNTSGERLVVLLTDKGQQRSGRIHNAQVGQGCTVGVMTIIGMVMNYLSELGRKGLDKDSEAMMGQTSASDTVCGHWPNALAPEAPSAMCGQVLASYQPFLEFAEAVASRSEPELHGGQFK